MIPVTTKYYRKNPAKKKEHNKRYARKLKLEVLTHYSGNPPKCTCCEETHIEFLTIDHIHGGGSRQTREVGRGKNFYQWLKRNHFPKGFRVLCLNCNFSFGHYGYCPLCPELKQEVNRHE